MTLSFRAATTARTWSAVSATISVSITFGGGITAATLRRDELLADAVAQRPVEHPVGVSDRPRGQRAAGHRTPAQQRPVPGDEIGRA